jgi:hypothetical protein
MTPSTRAALGTALLAVPVAVEAFWLHTDDGLPGHLLFAASQLVGWGLQLTVVLDLRRRRVGGRVLPRLVLAAVASQMAFAATYGLTAGWSGEPAGASFGFFLLGFLLLAIGGVGWGIRLRRVGMRSAGAGLVAAGGLGFLALAVGGDPWHDVMLLSSYLAWVVVGLGSETVMAGPQIPSPVHDAGHVTEPA